MSTICLGGNRQRLWTSTFWNSKKKEFSHFYTDKDVSKSNVNITQEFMKKGKEKGKFKENSGDQINIMYTHQEWDYGFVWFASPVISPNMPATCIGCIQQNKFKPLVQLRGVCDKTAFDFNFHFMLDDTGHMKLQGFKHSTIFFNFTLNMWQMQSHITPSAVAYSKSLRQNLALGLNTWMVSNDNECQIGEVEIELKLTTCGEDEFTCSNGLCVSINERCDSARHCDDWSDEIGCSLTKLPESYMKQIPPIQIIDKKIIKVPVTLSIWIDDVLEVSDISVADTQGS